MIYRFVRGPSCGSLEVQTGSITPARSGRCTATSPGFGSRTHHALCEELLRRVRCCSFQAPHRRLTSIFGASLPEGKETRRWSRAPSSVQGIGSSRLQLFIPGTHRRMSFILVQAVPEGKNTSPVRQTLCKELLLPDCCCSYQAYPQQLTSILVKAVLEEK